MDEQLTGHASGEAATTEVSPLAERLIREEFGSPMSAANGTAPVPASAIHEEFAEPVRPSGSRSQRAGMLAGLGVVGALLAVLVVLSPGSGQPRLPVQSGQDVGPIAASGPKTAAATVLPAALPSTTSSTTTPTTQPHRSETVPTTVTYVYAPGTTTPTPATAPTSAPGTPAPTSATAPTPAPGTPAPTATTSPPPPPATTTTTAPPTTTTTAKHCILGLIC